MPFLKNCNHSVLSEFCSWAPFKAGGLGRISHTSPIGGQTNLPRMKCCDFADGKLHSSNVLQKCRYVQRWRDKPVKCLLMIRDAFTCTFLWFVMCLNRLFRNIEHHVLHWAVAGFQLSVPSSCNKQAQTGFIVNVVQARCLSVIFCICVCN